MFSFVTKKSFISCNCKRHNLSPLPLNGWARPLPARVFFLISYGMYQPSIEKNSGVNTESEWVTYVICVTAAIIYVHIFHANTTWKRPFVWICYWYQLLRLGQFARWRYMLMLNRWSIWFLVFIVKIWFWYGFRYYSDSHFAHVAYYMAATVTSSWTSSNQHI